MKKKIIWIAIVLLGILSVGTLLYYIKNQDKKLDLQSDLVQNLYKVAIPDDTAYYLNEIYVNKSITDNYKLSVALTSLTSYPDDDFPVGNPITKEEIQKKSINIFNEEINFKNIEIDRHSDPLQFNYKWIDACIYDYDEKNVILTPLRGCDASLYNGIYRKLISAEKKNNIITLTEKVVFEDIELADNWEYTDVRIFADSDKKNLIKKYTLDDFGKEGVSITDNIIAGMERNYPTYIKDNLDQGSTYKLIFEKVKDHYIFKSIEFVEK